jgi:hypothetical protein
MGWVGLGFYDFLVYFVYLYFSIRLFFSILVMPHACEMVMHKATLLVMPSHASGCHPFQLGLSCIMNRINHWWIMILLCHIIETITLFISVYHCLFSLCLLKFICSLCCNQIWNFFENLISCFILRYYCLYFIVSFIIVVPFPQTLFKLYPDPCCFYFFINFDLLILILVDPNPLTDYCQPWPFCVCCFVYSFIVAFHLWFIHELIILLKIWWWLFVWLDRNETLNKSTL